MPADPTEATTLDALLGGRLMLCQPKLGHRAGHDAILLAAATAVATGERIADLGAGAGQAGLAVAVRARESGIRDTELLMIEHNAALARLAADNAVRNGIVARAIELDIGSPAAAFAGCGLTPDSVDRVLMNPPFNDASRHRASAEPQRSAAHMASADTLEIFLHAARRILKPGGSLTLIWRAEGLGEVLQKLSRGFGSVAVLPVHPRENEAASRILVGAIKGGRVPLALRPGLVLHDDAGASTLRADAILRGEASIGL